MIKLVSQSVFLLQPVSAHKRMFRWSANRPGCTVNKRLWCCFVALSALLSRPHDKSYVIYRHLLDTIDRAHLLHKSCVEISGPSGGWVPGQPGDALIIVAQHGALCGPGRLFVQCRKRRRSRTDCSLWNNKCCFLRLLGHTGAEGWAVYISRCV